MEVFGFIQEKNKRKEKKRRKVEFVKRDECEVGSDEEEEDRFISFMGVQTADCRVQSNHSMIELSV